MLVLLMPYAIGKGLRLAYEVAGEGTPVLLVMGFLMRGAAWRFQVPTLATRHRVCTFDNRGAGGVSEEG